MYPGCQLMRVSSGFLAWVLSSLCWRLLTVTSLSHSVSPPPNSALEDGLSDRWCAHRALSV